MPVSKVRVEYEASLVSLLRLRETLDQFHGNDAADKERPRNTQEVQLTEEDLGLLRAVVGSAIALHHTPTIPARVKELLRVVYEFLVEMKERLDRLSETFDSLTLLAFKVGEADLAIKELLDIISGS